uniref:coagulation factor XI-like n=1 Tax=Scatophagus argus TaxID=75038 RepID=UPI001ED8469F|nr:coagulation factor XI-like [Scatophagus argus]
MATNFILVGLLCLSGLSQSHDCKRELLVNVDFPGTDIVSLFSPDAEHCQQLCTQHSSCLFFSFLRHDWTGDNRQFYCYLKSTSSGKPKVETSLLGITSGFSLKACNPDPQPCLSQVYHHVNFLGGDYRTLFTADYEECQKACTSDPACHFFTFVDENFTTANISNRCFLKRVITMPAPPRVVKDANTVSGFSLRNCYKDIVPTIPVNKY